MTNEDKKPTTAKLWNRREVITAKLAELSAELKQIEETLRAELDK